MRKQTLLLLVAGAALAGCSTVDPTIENGPEGTAACFMQVDASRPGVQIETNHVYAGKAPLTLKLFGNKDGTFHDFGSAEFVVTALPAATNRPPQNKSFKTGKSAGMGSRIPGLLYFNIDQPAATMTLDSLPP
jgi:hypothetical protein